VSTVDYRVSRKNGNVGCCHFSRSCSCALRASYRQSAIVFVAADAHSARPISFLYPHTPWWACVRSSVHCSHPLLTSAFLFNRLRLRPSIRLRLILVLLGAKLLYYAPPSLTLAPHTSVALRAGFGPVCCATSCYWHYHMPWGDVVWPMVNSICHGNVWVGT
jgi:hypothetical protein